jgi:hypothetical protein
MTIRAFSRRRFGGLVCGGLLLAPGPAWAGTYLNRAVVLLVGALREASYLRARVADRELAGVVHRLAQARLEAAGAMTSRLRMRRRAAKSIASSRITSGRRTKSARSERS